MKKRLFCLFLCLVTVLSLVLTSCSEKTEEEATDNIQDAASEVAITLSMWVVSEDEIPAATAKKVTEALNTITKSKFKVQLAVNYITTDQYSAILEENITKYEANRKNQATIETEAPESGEVVTDETMTNELGMSVIKYPDLLQNQVDIIYIAGEDMYVDFINKGWLAELDTELSSSSKKIKEYVSATLLSAAKYNGTTYAIPNNRIIGEYNYMLLNKSLMDKYAQDGYISTNMIDGLYNENLYPFLNMVSMWEPNVIPIDASYKDCLDLLAHYWNISSDDYSVDMLNNFSLFGYRYTNIEELSRGSVILGYDSLFADKEFVKDYLQLNTFRFKDYLRKESDETRTVSAVKFVTGDATVLEKGIYKDTDGTEYYPIVVGYPTATSTDIYGNMFGVCKYTRSVSRSMEIITYLNTNADFRNLLQYGVENIDYKLVEKADKSVCVESLDTGYKMNIYATGNTFIAYHPQKGISPDVWDSGKVQNRSSLVKPTLGFNFAEFAATTGPAAEPPKYNATIGYSISTSTGYSKDVLSQNETIGAWLKEADAAGKGVYVLKTFAVEGSNQTIKYYVYNNDLSTGVDFSVGEVAKIQQSTDKKGNLIETQVGADLTFTYTPNSETSKGYNISVVSIFARKTHTFDLFSKLGEEGEATATTVKEAALINFDFLDTKEYTIEIYETLSKTELLKNQDLMNWIRRSEAKSPSTYLMEYQDGNEFIYVLYRTALKTENEVTITPVGDAGNLELIFDIAQYSDSLPAGSPNYLIYYIRVNSKIENLNVSYKYVLDGKTTTIPTANVTGGINPDFEMIGNLDTELVKFLEQVNTDLIGLLDKCYADGMAAINAATTAEEKAAAINTAIANYTALVNDISALMGDNDPDLFTYDPQSFSVLYINYSYRLGGLTASSFAEYVKSACSYKPVKKVDSETGEPLKYQGEDFVYFDSPYGIYYAWLQAFGFLPATKK